MRMCVCVRSPADTLSAEGASLTYGQLLAAINRAKNGLKAAGFVAGDVVALHLPNLIQVCVFVCVSV
jgi:acyl-coenzyme A synthetase/AMP-(fatty) acid ligase